jgi:hypothetical protein
MPTGRQERGRKGRYEDEKKRENGNGNNGIEGKMKNSKGYPLWSPGKNKK